MGNPEEQKQPEGNRREQVAARRRAKYIESAKAQGEKSSRRSKLLANTPLGKWWAQKSIELKKTRGGKIVLIGVGIAQVVLLFAAGIAVLIGVRFGLDEYVFPADYNLTDAQKDEGYSRTTSSGRNATLDDVYYRFYNDDEYGDQNCGLDSSWCIYALARNKGCPSIYMEFATREEDNVGSAVLEVIEVTKIAPNGEEYQMGERVTLGVVSKNPKAEYGSVERIYCRGLD